jgi:hypothetical protein
MTARPTFEKERGGGGGCGRRSDWDLSRRVRPAEGTTQRSQWEEEWSRQAV